MNVAGAWMDAQRASQWLAIHFVCHKADEGRKNCGPSVFATGGRFIFAMICGKSACKSNIP
jgi:hypothetical protein